jgi:signal peptidase I
MNLDNLKSVIYTGPSMNTTLRAGDELQVEPHEGKKIRAGDVIVFISPENGHKITHRVISVHSRGIQTRGDNNKNIDPWVLSPENIVGRVSYYRRGKRRKKVLAGTIGQLFAVEVKATKMVDSGITLLLRPVYRWMVRTGFIRRLFHNQIKQRVISLSRPEGVELQLLIGRCVIGRLRSGKAQWQIRRPFRLFLDEASLPKGT